MTNWSPVVTEVTEGGFLRTGAAKISWDLCVFLETDIKGPQSCLLFQLELVKNGDLELGGPLALC